MIYVMVGVASLSLLERKVLGYIDIRRLGLLVLFCLVALPKHTTLLSQSQHFLHSPSNIFLQLQPFAVAM